MQQGRDRSGKFTRLSDAEYYQRYLEVYREKEAILRRHGMKPYVEVPLNQEEFMTRIAAERGAGEEINAKYAREIATAHAYRLTYKQATKLRESYKKVREERIAENAMLPEKDRREVKRIPSAYEIQLETGEFAKEYSEELRKAYHTYRAQGKSAKDAKEQVSKDYFFESGDYV